MAVESDEAVGLSAESAVPTDETEGKDVEEEAGATFEGAAIGEAVPSSEREAGLEGRQ